MSIENLGPHIKSKVDERIERDRKWGPWIDWKVGLIVPRDNAEVQIVTHGGSHEYGLARIFDWHIWSGGSCIAKYRVLKDVEPYYKFENAKVWPDEKETESGSIHYMDESILDVIEVFELDFHVAQAVSFLLDKELGEKLILESAIRYLNRKLINLKE